MAAAPSLSDLVTTCTPTTGDVPPPMVGSSLTILGSCIYLFGGRPVHSPTPTADLYILSLDSRVWSKMQPSRSSPALPTPRYLHSATVYGSRIIIFGGEGPSRDDSGQLEELGDALVFETTSRRWETAPLLAPSSGVEAPEPRCAHLALTSSHSLYIFGGQSARGRARTEHLRDLAVLDLRTWRWQERVVDIGRTCGAYRTAAAGSGLSYVPPTSNGGLMSPSCSRRAEETIGDEAAFLLYSNSDLKSEKIHRDLDLLTFSTGTSSLRSLSHLMAHPPLPAGLRFPTSFAVGRFFVVTGVQVDSAGAASLAVWALDLDKGVSSLLESPDKPMEWRELELGQMLKQGSWGKAMVRDGKLVVLGKESRSMTKDYASRQQSFSTIASVDLEAFGIRQPPLQLLSTANQHLGLRQLEDKSCTNTYSLFTADRELLKCSRRLLVHRWTWLAEQLDSLVLSDDSDLDGPTDVLDPDAAFFMRKSSIKGGRLLVTPSAVHLPLDSPSTLALLQYFHTLSLSSPLQHPLSILRSLLVFASGEASLPHLRSLAVHALHDGLDSGQFAAAQVYEIATLGGSVGEECLALQVRALSGIMKDVGEPATIAERKRLSVIRAPSSFEPPALVDFGVPDSPPPSFNLDSPVGPHLSLPSSARRGSAASSAGSAFSRLSPAPASGLRSDSQGAQARHRSLSLQSTLPTVEPTTPLREVKATRHPSPAPQPPTASPPRLSSPPPAPHRAFLSSPTRLPQSSSIDHVLSPPSAPAETTSAEVVSAVKHSTKGLTIVVEPPPGSIYHPGGALTLSLLPSGSASLASTFSLIRVRLLGLSTLSGANLLPSFHTVLDVSQDAELPSAIMSSRIDVLLPSDVTCSCRPDRCSLPPSGRVLLGQAGLSSAAEGTSIMVSYRMEITLKRKGWGKGTEKVALPLPYPIESQHLYGGPLLLAPDLGTALASVQRYPLPTWPSTTFSQQQLTLLPADFARLSHWRTVLPSTIFLSWHITLHLPRRDADNLARLINAGGLEGFAGRRLTPFVTGKGESGNSRLFRTKSKGAGKHQVTVAAGEMGSVGLVDVEGWLELAKEDVKNFSACNGRVQHFLVLQLPSILGTTPCLLEAELGLPSSTASAQSSVVDLRTGHERLSRPEEGGSYPSSLTYLYEDERNPSLLRPKRPDPPSILSADTASLNSQGGGGMKRSTSLSLDFGTRPLPRSPSRRNSFSQASHWSTEADQKSTFSAAVNRRKIEREMKAAREEEEQKLMKARAAKAASTRGKADSTGRHLPYAGFFM